MAAIKAILNDQNKTVDGLYPIVIRIQLSNPKRRRYFPTGHRVGIENWDAVNEKVVDTKKPWFDKDLMNATISDMLADAKWYDGECSRKGKAFSMEEVFNAVATDGSFTDFLQKYVEKFSKASQVCSYQLLKSTRTQFLKFSKKSNVYYSDISKGFISRYADYLIEERGNSAKTVNDKIAYLGTYYERAINRVGAPAPNPFKSF